jgi:hypothetical protein
MKKTFYIFCFVVLGLVLSSLAHAIIEIGYIQYSFAKGIVLTNHPFFIGHSYCALPIWLQMGLIIAGILWGYWQGKRLWSKLYDKNGRVRNPKFWRI